MLYPKDNKLRLKYFKHVWYMNLVVLHVCYDQDCAIIKFIIHLSYTVRIPIFSLAGLYHVILRCDETTSLTSLPWCKSHRVNSTHHCHYTMALADSNKMLMHSVLMNYLDLPLLCSLTMNLKFSILHLAKP